MGRMPSEESPKEQAHALAVRAREALPLERSAYQTTGVEAAIGLLAQAVERLTSNSPFIHLHLDEGSEQLERVREMIIGGQGPLRSVAPGKFVISFPDVELDVSEIWPDGAPENPTPEDVIAVMKEQECAHPTNVAVQWLLIDRLYVRAAADENGDEEVEWDGT